MTSRAGVPGKQVQAGDALTACSLPLDMFGESAYIRVTVIDAAGGRAWSNPIWLVRGTTMPEPGP